MIIFGFLRRNYVDWNSVFLYLLHPPELSHLAFFHNLHKKLIKYYMSSQNKIFLTTKYHFKKILNIFVKILLNNFAVPITKKRSHSNYKQIKLQRMVLNIY